MTPNMNPLDYIKSEVQQVLPQYFHAETELKNLQEGDSYYSFDNEKVVILHVFKPGLYLLESQRDPGSAGLIATAKDLSRMPLSGAPLIQDDLASLRMLVTKAAKEFERQVMAKQSKIIT